MKLTKLTIIILVTIAGLAGFVWWRTSIPRPLYGKASLSKEEKLILAKPFEDYRHHNYERKAYTVAMICLKHHLTIPEVNELITGQVDARQGNSTEFRYGPGPERQLFFDFDDKGKLLSIDLGRGQFRLPPLELVTKDAPIESPPLPRMNDFYTKAAIDLQASRERQAVVRTDAFPPDFVSLSYADLKAAVDLALIDIYDLHTRLVAGYSLKVVDQLKEKSLADDKKALAIYLLGELKSSDTNSIDALIERINFKVIVPYGTPEWRSLYPWSLYPSRDALLRIGEASVSPIVQSLPGETNALRRHLLCAVLSTFGRTNWTTGWQPKTAIDQLQRLRATESEPARQHNIDAALGLLIDNKVDVNIGWSGYFGE